MTMITGQLQPSDTSKQKFAVLADEGGINATLWFGAESVVLQVNETGQVVLAYDDGRGGNRKPLFMGFFHEIAATRSFAQIEPDGTMAIELAVEQKETQSAPEPEEDCEWCGRSYPKSEMNSIPWGGDEKRIKRICDRCCDEGN